MTKDVDLLTVMAKRGMDHPTTSEGDNWLELGFILGQQTQQEKDRELTEKAILMKGHFETCLREMFSQDGTLLHINKIPVWTLDKLHKLWLQMKEENGK